MKWMYKIMILACLVSLFTSCTSKHTGVTGEQKLKKRTANYVFNKLDKYHIDASWLDAKASVKLTQKNSTNTATAYIRMKADEAIWVSVRKFGFEGGRLLVTPDSVFLLNRLNKDYVAEPFSYIQKRTGLKSSNDKLTDFRNLYDLVLGNVVMKEDGKYKVTVDGTNYNLSKEKGGITSSYSVDGLRYTLVNQSFNQDDVARRASCAYGKYEKSDKNYLFSHLRKFTVYSNETGTIKVNLDFSKVTFDTPASMKFSIPKSYERVR